MGEWKNGCILEESVKKYSFFKKGPDSDKEGSGSKKRGRVRDKKR
jgi:hypothetical protein